MKKSKRLLLRINFACVFLVLSLSGCKIAKEEQEKELVSLVRAEDESQMFSDVIAEEDISIGEMEEKYLIEEPLPGLDYDENRIVSQNHWTFESEESFLYKNTMERLAIVYAIWTSIIFNYLISGSRYLLIDIRLFSCIFLCY